MNNRKIHSALLTLILIAIIFFISPGRTVNEFQNVNTANIDPLPGWNVENGWSINGSELIGNGQGRANYERACGEGPLTFSFKLKNLEGSLNININANNSSRYVIQISNNGNGTLSTNLIRSTGTPRYESFSGQMVTYSPGRVYQVDIYSDRGTILVSIHKADSIADSAASRVAYLPAIDYSDRNPLPPGNISFETYATIDTNTPQLVSVYDIAVNCTSQSQDYVPPDLKTGYFLRPNSSSLISTIWGDVPANQVLIVVDNNLTFDSAQIIAGNLANDILHGQIVGEFEYINLFQIETKSQNLTELLEDLSRSKNFSQIILAFPNEQVFRESDILDSRVYPQGKSKGFDLIGVQKAWEKIKSSNANLSDVHVGVTDNGLYRGYGEFNGIVQINTSSSNSNLSKAREDFPSVGSHGTGVMNILAADPDNGGLTGIASEPLREKLLVTMENIFPDSLSYSTDCLLDLKDEIEGGSTILSCSWGDSNAKEDTASAYYLFFKKLSQDYPCLLFVCSAGNDGRKIDGTKRTPNGRSQSNMITVGNIQDNGDRVVDSNMNSDSFEVTLFAPGENAYWGWDRGTNVMHNRGGTSMATPHVTAAAAILRSLNPYLKAYDIKTILKENADPSPSDPDGLNLNISAAVEYVLKNPARCSNKCKKCTEKVKEKIKIPDNSDNSGSAKTEANPAAEGPLSLVSFTFTPNPVCAGETTKMSWTTTGAIGVTITPGIGTAEPSGFRILSPKLSMGYTIRAWNNSSNTKPKTVLLGLEQCIVKGGTSTSEDINTVYDFTEEAQDQGLWLAGPKDAIFKFGSRTEDDMRGSAMWKNNWPLNDLTIAKRVLQVRPPENGYIMGTYRYMNYIVDANDIISGRIGFVNGVHAGNAIFSIHLIEGNIDRTIFQRTLSYNDGPLSFNIPLRPYAGWQPDISLRVDSNGPSQQGAAVWQDVVITGSTNRPVAIVAGKNSASDNTISPDSNDWNPSGSTFDQPSESNVDWLNRQ